MPRPRRARYAQPSAEAVAANSHSTAAEPSSDNDNGLNTRGRARMTRSSAARLSKAEQELVRAANRSRDAALDRLANEDITTTSGNTPEDDTNGSPEVGRRDTATPAQRRDTTGLDLADDDVFGDLDDSFGDGAAPQPRSAETTSISLSSFKPRSRQSSIIGRNDPPIRPSSRSGNTPGLGSSLNLGVFKRRAREPSILGTSRKPRHDNTTATATTHDSELDSEDEFAPEAVSTPVNNRRQTRASCEMVQPAEVSKLNNRKRKSEEARLEDERPGKSSRAEPENPLSDDNTDSELSSLPSPQQAPHLIAERPVTPNRDYNIAPPASSGSESEGVIWPDIHALAKRRRRPSITTPVRADTMSDVSSPPSLTHSPNHNDAQGQKARGRTGALRQQSPKFTTADLANMLPKRRYKKHQGEFGSDDLTELDNSGLGQDDDELSHLDARAARRRRGKREPRPARSGSRLSRETVQAEETQANSLQPKQTRVSSRPGLRSKTQAHPASDKENESQSEDDEEEEPSRFVPMPDHTFDTDTTRTVEGLTTDELKRASKKFKEVDQWELSFEEVAPTSSPQGAR